MRLYVNKIVFVCLLLLFITASADEKNEGKLQNQKKMVYLVSDITIPFWSIMAKGVEQEAGTLGYSVDVYSADNDKKNELALAIQAIRDKVAALIISPISSSSSVTLLKLASKAGVPVVILDIGTEKGEYVSYITSNNRAGSYALGQLLVQAIERKGWENASVGIIAIPQTRKNGRDRTQGFIRAISEGEINSVGIKQQKTFSYQETYDFSQQLMATDETVRAIWLQGSSQYQAALDAIDDAGKMKDVLLVCFDSEPEFMRLIPQGVITAAAMQQPYLMGRKSVSVMDQYLKGNKVERIIELPVLPISADNIKQNIVVIETNVLGVKP